MASRLDPAVARARFATFVARALDQARVNGITDKKITEKSGVSSSTFHRWKNGEGRDLPQLDKVSAFCDAVGASLDDAMKALGMTDAAPEPTPETPLPRDVVVILRLLADPNTAESEREFFAKTLQMLANRAAVATRAEKRARDAS